MLKSLSRRKRAARRSLTSTKRRPKRGPVRALNKCRRCEALSVRSRARSGIVECELPSTIVRISCRRSSRVKKIIARTEGAVKADLVVNGLAERQMPGGDVVSSALQLLSIYKYGFHLNDFRLFSQISLTKTRRRCPILRIAKSSQP